MHRPRIVLAEDRSSIAEQLRLLLAGEFDVIATVDDGRALQAVVDDLRPDVVVTDVAMPGLDGISATAAILARRPGTRVVVVTVHGDPELAERAYAAGALGYVVKLDAAGELALAIRSATRGNRYVSRRIREAGAGWAGQERRSI